MNINDDPQDNLQDIGSRNGGRGVCKEIDQDIPINNLNHQSLETAASDIKTLRKLHRIRTQGLN